MHDLAVGRIAYRMEEAGAGRSLAKKDREEKRILEVMVGFQLAGCLTGWNKQRRQAWEEREVKELLKKCSINLNFIWIPSLCCDV